MLYIVLYVKKFWMKMDVDEFILYKINYYRDLSCDQINPEKLLIAHM